jgi:hypothetical protein
MCHRPVPLIAALPEAAPFLFRFVAIFRNIAIPELQQLSNRN